uniref:DNA integrity scanning protein DisA n=1 Tax=Clostridioides difficile TaxID=1496 RepID=A0A381KMY7_CLODI|nr:DNA integrity scanning protein DisA [Clostridioides difficile]
MVTIYDVALVMQKMEMVMRVTSIIEKYVIELGDEGTLVSMQLEELMGTTRIDQKLIFKDYNKENTEIKELMKRSKI